MHRAVIAVSAGLLVAMCSHEKASQDAPPSPAASPASNGEQGSTALGIAAGKVTDACTVMPTDLAARIAPGASAPTGERFPPRCTVSNATSVVQLTFDNGPGEPVSGAESIPGLGEGGYLEHLDPKDKGDVYLTVICGADAGGLNHNFHVEVAGHDGKDHTDDAIGLAKAVIAQLK